MIRHRWLLFLRNKTTKFRDWEVSEHLVWWCQLRQPEPEPVRPRLKADVRAFMAEPVSLSWTDMHEEIVAEGKQVSGARKSA